MTRTATLAPGPTKRTALVHAGGRCDLRCASATVRRRPRRHKRSRAPWTAAARAWWCAGRPSAAPRSATSWRGRAGRGFAEIVLRTNATSRARRRPAPRPLRASAPTRCWCRSSRTPRGARSHRRRRRGALSTRWPACSNLARAGLGVEIEVPILPPRLQRLDALVGWRTGRAGAARACGSSCRRGVAPRCWRRRRGATADRRSPRALLLCRELRIAARLGARRRRAAVCAARHPDLYDVYAFNPKARSAQRGRRQLRRSVRRAAPCARSARGAAVVLRGARGRGHAAYAQRPALMYEQRTTRRRVWTPEQRAPRRGPRSWCCARP